MIGEEVHHYDCQDNDAKLAILYVDGKPDEVHVQIEGDSGWLIVGFDDLLRAMPGLRWKPVVQRSNTVVERRNRL